MDFLISSENVMYLASLTKRFFS